MVRGRFSLVQPTAAPVVTPPRKQAISPAGSRTDPIPSSALTPSCVVLPDMKLTK
jgi:hypothetical protein